ncbi:TetR family transcriptional regulator [Shewanella abyssi]|uniref:TetR/AcrR family transcriptional regulator n=1 Tax=Shewanella abyssi TaxID=311789 RepID=UPI00200F7F68|nr:TetR/AcrR family transcriptional regulator [Shewanella abyssi]MCL1048403.1 TetR family transcriptional regulator [Shewanella abyssi]
MTDQKSESATQVRDSLIRAARICFIASDYDKVSIRQIAEVAGVNMAMIRYYFGNKLGLFEAMVAEFILPVLQRKKTMQKNGEPFSPADLMADFYQRTIATPDFPRFLFRLMSTEHSNEAKEVILKLFSPLTELTPMPESLLDKCSDIDPLLVKMSMMSLMIFPFVIPKAMAELHGFELDGDFYQRLAKHNIKLLEHGLFGEQD